MLVDLPLGGPGTAVEGCDTIIAALLDVEACASSIVCEEAC